VPWDAIVSSVVFFWEVGGSGWYGLGLWLSWGSRLIWCIRSMWEQRRPVSSRNLWTNWKRLGGEFEDFGSVAVSHNIRASSNWLTLAASRLFIPVEEKHEQHIYVIDKDENGKVTTKKEYGVKYVPLTDAPE
jgi:hypothetical protein